MRYFTKKELDQNHLFNLWIAENSSSITEWINNENKNGDTLWKEFGKSFGQETNSKLNSDEIRNQLLDSLYEEQNGLCCYCGNLIKRTKNKEKNNWEYYDYCIEHFLPKNKFKNLTFQYNNLFLCCKESKTTFFEIERTPKENPIKNFDDVAEITKIALENILFHSKNKSYIDKSGKQIVSFKKGDKIYFPNPAHCDDSKSNYDGKPVTITILNPSKDENELLKLNYDQNGNLLFPSDNEIYSTTEKVLALNCETLKERRKEIWKLSEINISELQQLLIIDHQIIDKLIKGKELPNDSLELEAFYFVEIAYLKSLLNGFTSSI